MRRLLSVGVFLVCTAGFFGCAHGSHVSGSVVMKHGEQEGHICIDGEKVKVGDKVSLFSSSCRMEGSGKMRRNVCSKHRLGEGQVTEIIDKHFATIKAEGVALREGLIVERH